MIDLKVHDAKQRDVARGVGRIDQSSMEKLGISAGDAVEIIGEKSTAVIAWPGYDHDENKGLVRIDGFARKNAGTSIGEVVNVRPAKVKDALHITLEPEEIHLNVDEDFIGFVKNRLNGRVFVEGDSTLVMLLSNPIQFIVFETTPNGVVRMTNDTDLRIKSDPGGKKASEKGVLRSQLGSLASKLRIHSGMGRRGNTVMTRLNDEDLKQIDMMVGIGLFESRSEAVALLTHEGIIVKKEMLDQLSNKYEQIEKIRDEAKSLLGTSAPISGLKECPKCNQLNNPESKFCSHCGEKLD